jgi:hypothetical protein
VKAIIYFILAMIAGFCLLMPLGLLCDALRWPLFNTRDLAQGSFFIAWPVLTLLSLSPISYIGSRIGL